MANPFHHAVSSSRRWGGTPDDYIEIHHWFDESKAFFADFRHRALRHHAEGIFLCERIFGHTIEVVVAKVCEHCRDVILTNDQREGGFERLMTDHTCAFGPNHTHWLDRVKRVPVRWIGEQHVEEDLGFIPPVSHWLERIQAEPWMNRSRRLSRELDSQVTEKRVVS